MQMFNKKSSEKEKNTADSLSENAPRHHHGNRHLSDHHH